MSRRASLLRIVASTVVVLVAARLGRTGLQTEHEDPAARLEVAVLRGDNGRTIPARVYLFKDDKPFRLSPVDVLLPLRPDLFYRERLWRRPPEPAGAEHPRPARTLEVTNDGDSHFLLLDGQGQYDLPAGSYRLEAYRGLFWTPVSETFVLKAGERRRVTLRLEPIAADAERWLSGDDHIHLVRAAEDNDVFLGSLQADDLSVGNFLQLQRQAYAAVQYAFGREGEATSPGFAIRSGQESRSEFYGHVNLLGGSRLHRPVSIGSMYANTPEAYPFPNRVFAEARALGATVGYAHFDGSMKHSALLMDLAQGGVDFVEVFQFGILKTEPWYALLNAGFRVTGIAGSDFPGNLGRFKPWPRVIPLFGPERTLVKLSGERQAEPGRSAYDLWIEGVRRGAAVVSNGPLLDFVVEGQGPGSVIAWTGDSKTLKGEVRAAFHRPLEILEVVINGQVRATLAGDGHRKELRLSFELPITESVWVAARARAERLGNEPTIQAHTNPVYVLRDRRPVHIKAAREALAARWKQEMGYYRGPDLTFADPEQRKELEAKLEETARVLESEPRPWP